LFDGTFQYRASIAEKTGVFKPTGTAPDDGLFTAIIPMHPAEDLTAVLDVA
jgi:hypothetical protein